MELSYCECTVKRANRRLKFTKYLWCISIVYFLFINIFILQTMIFTLVLLLYTMALILVWPNFDAEYEYVYCDGQIDFDLIRSGRKRKTLKKIDLINAELICGVYDEERLKKYKNFTWKKCYGSGMAFSKAYYIILREGAQFARIEFEPNERMLECIRSKKPRITFSNEGIE